MIAVVRKPAPLAEEALAAIGKDGKTELQRAIGHFLHGDPKKKPSFSAYSKDEVKQALNELFHKKCAYCESRYDHVAPMDVEHYRPKNGFLDEDGKLAKPGYYWLAAAWENLLPSCIGCNRERKQLVRSDGKLVKSKSGKGNKFPLEKGSPRAAAPDQHRQEKPLLLDPCQFDPRLHLQFDEDGVALPTAKQVEAKAPRGERTIEVCGLNREELVGERKAVAKRVQEAMEAKCRALRRIEKYPDDKEFEQDLKRANASLKGFASAGEPYVAMVQGLMRTFNAVHRTVVRYREALNKLDGAPGDPGLDAEVTKQVAALKKRLAPDSLHARMAGSMMVWLDVEGL